MLQLVRRCLLSVPWLLVSSAAAQSPTAVEPVVNVRGQCLLKGGGGPLADVRVECVRFEDGAALPLASPITTRADGHFEFVLELERPTNAFVIARAPGLAPALRELHQLGRVRQADLGPLPMEPGFVLEGRLVQPDGAPAADVALTLTPWAPPPWMRALPPGTPRARSGPDGAFRFEDPVAAGEWHLATATRGWKAVDELRRDVDAERGIAPIRLAVRRLPSIAGRVVDAEGLGVAGVHLALADLQGGRGQLWVDHEGAMQTGADGEFELFSVDAEPDARRVHVLDPGPCARPTELGPMLALGTRDARIVLERVALELEVIEQGSGAPIEDFEAVAYEAWAFAGQPLRVVRSPGVHPGGRTSLPGVEDHSWVIQVQPSDASLLPGQLLEFLPTARLLDPFGRQELVSRPERASLRVELERMRARTVRVVELDGTPVAGARVVLFRAVTKHGWVYRSVLDDRLGDDEPYGLDSRPAYLVVSSGTSDTRGEVELFAPRDLERVLLRVEAAEHLTQVVERPDLHGPSPLEIPVPSGASVEGRIGLLGYLQLRPELVFVRPGETPRSAGHRAALGPGGAFPSVRLAPGPVALHLAVSDRRRDVREVLEPPVLELEVAEGERRVLNFEAEAWGIATLSGRVRIDGVSPTGGTLELWRDGSRPRPEFVRHGLVRDGRFHLDLPPGRWRARIAAHVGDQVHELEWPEVLELAGGERRELDLDLPR